jgi:Regulator of chromosome condensation (RCC1) repeat
MVTRVSVAPVLALLWLHRVHAAGTAALIGPGKRHTCVIRTEGSLVCYGEGSDGS